MASGQSSMRLYKLRQKQHETDFVIIYPKNHEIGNVVCGAFLIKRNRFIKKSYQTRKTAAFL